MEKIVERQIKFRALKDDMSNPNFVYGSLIYHDGSPRIQHSETLTFYTCLKGTDGQFTGLPDKNGTEIYDGDIVRILYTDWPSKSGNDERTLEQYMLDISYTATVVWGDAEWILKFSDDNYGSIHCGKHGQIVVIGNIHSTPELLKN